VTQPTNHLDVLTKARDTVAERAAEYGGVSDCFTRIAEIATLMLNKPVTPHDVAMIQLATKLGRLAYNPGHADSYLDAVNYAAFASEFAPQPERALTLPRAKGLDEGRAYRTPKDFGGNGSAAIDMDKLANTIAGK
jgi:hypothetical protein